MFDSSFLAMDYPANPNPNNYNYSHFDPIMDPSLQPVEFQLSDFLMLDGGFGDDSSSQSTMVLSDQFASGASTEYSSGTAASATSENANNDKWKKGVKKEKAEVGHRVAFRTKSELEIMDDGFKWRKYGKKSVKNSPHPRNYYKCSSGGCSVKKRVERDREDPKYVITTYDGMHNHQTPCVVYYNHHHRHHYHQDQVPVMNPNGWNLQASSPSSSS
ncbi:probable WRKY transcription factor 51 [Ricinus communis]|uniref:WRKY transcription factor, putative n=1 Tax=Ricinus communis TaxID=3988 RepID=B9T535_RICCO|nr:probable WRKY transcription factor 51 [Ricinus communis]EEF29027.1 WRKY transcription factor, putative [Ricinus communis]|eukprot:XP_002533354.3 probable WRKY transcription factor 51 [Ricinus communis]